MITQMTTGDPPSFPFDATEPSNVHIQATRMTLRDWFAGQAPDMPDWFLTDGLDGDWEEDEPAYILSREAKWRYCFADAMIAARDGGAA